MIGSCLQNRVNQKTEGGECMTQEELNTLLEKVALDVQDIRRITGAGRDTAYALCKSGKFHVVRVGKNRIKVPTESFKRWWYGEGNFA